MRRRTSAAILLLSVGLAGLAALLLHATPPPVGDRSLPWWALALAFALAESIVVHLQVRRQSVSVSFGEIALVVGIAFSPPGEHLLACVVGSGAVLLLQRRQGVVKLAFNLALFALHCAVVLVVHGLLADGAAPLTAGAALATVAALVAGDLVSGLAVTAVVCLASGRIDREPLTEAATSGLVTALANTGVGLLVVVLTVTVPWALVPLLGLGAVLALLQRANGDLERGHSRVELLYGFLRGTAGGASVDNLVGRVLLDSRDALQAEQAELALRLPDGGWTCHRLQPDGAVVQQQVDTGWWTEAGAGLVRSADGRSLAVPLQADGAGLGVLAVSGRAAHLRPHGADEVSLLQSLADHVSVALAHAALVQRLREAVAEREHRARHDALTELLNRDGLLEHLAARSTVTVVTVVEVTSYESVCHALGAATGDALLRAVAARLERERPGGAARIGTALFVALGPAQHDDGRATDLALLSALAEPVLLDGFSLPVTVRAGSAETGPDVPPAMVLQRASTALRAERRELAVLPWTPGLDAGSDRRLRLVADLRRTVVDGGLEVHYQPKVDAATALPVGVEALVRWRHPELGPIGPDEFVPLAEQAGLIAPLTTHVLRTALADGATWHAAGWGLGVAVNISVSSLLDPTLPAQVDAALRQAGFPAASLTLEVTESGVMEDLQACLRVLHGLRALGVRLSVDDFGTGHSSLAYLKDLPVQELKIDRSFVRDADQEAGGAVLRSAVALGHALGLSVVAEGVEDAAGHAALHAWGCDVLQGFLFSRPLPRADLEAWLARQAGEAVPSQTKLRQSAQ